MLALASRIFSGAVYFLWLFPMHISNAPTHCATVTFLAAVTVLLTGCNAPAVEETGQSDATTSQPVGSLTPGDVWADKLDDALNRTKATKQGRGCPALSWAETQQFVAAHAKATYDTQNDGAVSRVTCRIEAFLSSHVFDRSTLNAAIRKYRPSTASSPRALPWDRSTTSQPKYALDGSLATKYPGQGRRWPGLGFSWVCGPYTVTFGAGPSFDVFQLDQTPDVAFLTIAENRVKQLCGTLQQPSPQVSQDPVGSWLIYETLGGASPAEFGSKRPTNMPTAPAKASAAPTKPERKPDATKKSQR